jgi:hypothetical protein
MPVGIASTTSDELYQEQQRLNKCADGTYAGLKSQTPNQQDVEGSAYRAFKKSCSSAQEYAKAVYEYAMKRDLPYCVHGRKAMRVQAVAGKLFSTLERGLAINQIEIEEEYW